MIKFKEVAHLYLGCEVEWGFDGRKKKGELVGKDERYGWQVFDPSNVIVPYQQCRIELIKPLLRPLSSMTDEEVLAICKRACENVYGDYRFSKWTVGKSPHEMCHWDVTNKSSRHSFTVSSIDGDVMLYDGQEVDHVYINSNHRFWYLKHGFDLFDLIPNGEAIDKTKQQP